MKTPKRLSPLRKEIYNLCKNNPDAPMTPSAVANSLSSSERPFTNKFRLNCLKSLHSLYYNDFITRVKKGSHYTEPVYTYPKPQKHIQLTLPPLASSPTEIYRVEGRLKMLYSSAGKNMVVFEWDKVERIKEA